MIRDPLCATFEKLTIAHTFRMRKFSSLPDPDQYGSSIDTRAEWILSRIFRANHTEVSSRINAVFCHVILSIYYLEQKVPRIQKIQNTSFIHQKWYCPLQSLPIDCNALMPALDPVLEIFLQLYCRYSHESRLGFFHYLLSVVKTRSP